MTSHRMIKEIQSYNTSGEISAESYNSAESIANHLYSVPDTQEVITLPADFLAESVDDRFFQGVNSL
jgi:hypothetical protein